MKQVYQTIDGRIFNEAADAEMYEQEIRQQVKMWNWSGKRTDNTAEARIIHLNSEEAAVIWNTMARENPEENGDFTFCEGDTGWYYWDEYSDKYRYIDPELVAALQNAIQDCAKN